MRKTVKVLLTVALAVLMVCTLVACNKTDTQQSGNNVNYTISFDSNGGSAVANMVVDGKSEITLPTTTKEGYFFAGWFVDNGTFQIPFDLYYIKANPNNTAITLYAKWLDVFDVTFEANGGSAVATQKVADGRFANQPPFPTKAGYFFDGWYKEASFVTAFNFRTEKITAKIIIYAKWVAVDDCLTFTFTDSSNSAYSVKQKSGATLPNIIDLPAEYKGKPVVAIDERAFSGCSSFTSVTIPSSVTSIGERAFDDCSRLTSVTIPESVTGMGYSAFSYCRSLASVTITEGVTSIGDHAFESCLSLTSITIPASVTSIGWWAFDRCSSLTSVTFEAGSKLTSIGEMAFSGCRSLTSVTIPASVTAIGYGPFTGCSSLTSITVESGNTKYKSIDGNLYSKDGSTLLQYAICKTDTSFTIPSSVTYIGREAFSDCSSLTSVTIPAGVTSIGISAFSCCSSLTSVTIPSSVTSIGTWAFLGCSSLTSVTIPSSVTSIGERAFWGCHSLTIYAEVASQPAGWDSYWNLDSGPVVWDSVNNSIASDGNIYAVLEGIRYALKEGNATVVGQASAITTVNIPVSVTFKNLTYNVTTIGSSAFDGCISLTSVTIPACVTSIGNEAFEYCISLTSVTIPSSVTTIGERAFDRCSSLTIYAEAASKPEGWNSNWNLDNCPVVWDSANNIIASDGNIYAVLEGIRYALKDGNATVVGQSSAITTANIPVSVTFKNLAYNVTSIGRYAFSICSNLTNITIPTGVTRIGASAFSSCRSLTSITIPSSVTSIGDWAFYGCSSLTSFTIPAGVTSIDDDAFAYCSSLISVTIPSSVTSIGSSAFWNCSSLTSITVESDNTKYKSIDGNLYSKDGCTLVQYAIGKTDTSFIIPSSVTYIGREAFSDCSSLTSITIPAGVTSIGWQAFSSCRGLTSVTIPASVTSIGERAFSDCRSLTSVTIPSGVISIGDWAFYDCSNLTIYAEAASKQTGWDSNWNPNNRTVVWGHNNITTNADYDYVIHNNEVYLTKYKGSNLDIVIPATIDGKAVVSIGEIFARNTTIKSAQIPSSVTSIGIWAFYGCSGLTSITLPFVGNTLGGTSNTDFGYIFGGSSSIPTSLKTVVITGGISIGDYAFYGCSSLTSVTFEAGSKLTSIGDCAFLNCSSLTSVTIPAGVTSIGWQAFRGCSSLTSVTIPSSVTSIGSGAFSGCSELTSMTLPFVGNTLGGTTNTHLGYIFGDSSSIPTSLKTVVITGGTSIGGKAFSGCRSLTSFTIPSSVTSIGYEAFAGCSSLTSFTIPASVTSIGEDAFSGCSSLTSVTIPAGVTSIGWHAFSGCSSLAIYAEAPNKPAGWGSNWNGNCPVVWGHNNITTNADYDYVIHNNEVYLTKYKGSNLDIVIPATIDGKAVVLLGSIFSGNTTIKSVQISAGVTSIGSQAFYECSSLTSVTIEAGSKLSSIGNYAFRGCSSLTSVTFEAGSKLTSIGESAFRGCSSLTSVTFEAGSKLTSIGESAFWSCSSLTSVTIPSGVISIGDWAFYDCSSLTSVTFEAGSKLTSIGDCAFLNCSSLTSVTIPTGVASIGWQAFSSCSSLTSVTIPSSVTSIGIWAFSGCSSLTSITVESDNTEYKSIDGNLYSKDGFTLLQYAICKTATSFTIPSSVTTIGSSAFDGCISLTSVTIPAGVTSIDNYAFRGCSSLTSVTIPADVTSIGAGTFSGCISLTSVTIPSSVTSIGERVFSECSGLTSVTIPASVTSIGDSAFSGCSSLIIYAEATSKPEGWDSKWNPNNRTVVWGHNNITTNADYDYVIHNNEVYLSKYKGSNLDIVVPTSIEGKAVVSIGAIFAGNTTIKSVQIPSSVTSIGERAFSGCSSLISVTIPSSVTSIGEMAFSGCRSLTSVTIPSSVTSIGYEAFSGCSRLTKINCKAASQPSGWKKNLYNSWKANCNATVVWGYTGA